MLPQFVNAADRDNCLALEATIGVPGNIKITYENKSHIRAWCILHGVPEVTKMSDATLWKCYNVEAYMRRVCLNTRGGDNFDDAFGVKPKVDTSIFDEDLAPKIKEVEKPPLISNDAAKQLQRQIDDIRNSKMSKADADRLIETTLAKIVKMEREWQARLEARITATQTLRIEVVGVAGEVRVAEMGRQHKLFPRLLKRVNMRLPDGNRPCLWLAGPAGSGKTSAAQACARALGMKFYFNGAIDNEYKLLGFTDAQGRIVSRPFREAFLNGGVYLFDEVDASLAPALLAFNAATSTGYADFPDGVHKRHPDCVIIAAGNTMGEGGNSKYVGRFKQDAAFADRFIFLKWGYDEDFERHLAGNEEWTDFVIKMRHRATSLGLEVVISPRASIFGAAILASGGAREEAIEECLKKSMSDEQWAALTSGSTQVEAYKAATENRRFR